MRLDHSWLCARSRLEQGLLGLLLSIVVARGFEGPSWRQLQTFEKGQSSFATAISLSPRGNLWVTRSVALVSKWNGFDLESIPHPGGLGNQRIYESRSGQIWAVVREGLAEYQTDGWTVHPVSDISSAFFKDITRRIPLLPAQRNRVLMLLPEALVEYTSSPARATTLLAAEDVSIGVFESFLETKDGDIIILGETGLARIVGPVRLVRAQPETEVHRWPSEWAMMAEKNLIQNWDGSVSFVGLNEEAIRFGVTFDGSQFTRLSFGEERVSFCWRHQKNGYWGVASAEGLFQCEEPSLVEFVGRGQFFDVTLGENGWFWLASIDGVVEYAPRFWRLENGWDGLNGPLYSIDQITDGTLICVGEQGLLVGREQGHSATIDVFPWPEGFPTPDRSVVHQLSDDESTFVVGMRDETVSFDLARKQFGRIDVSFPPFVEKVVGASRDGLIWVVGKTAGSIDEGVSVFICDHDGYRSVLDEQGMQEIGNVVYFAERVSPSQIWIGGARGMVLVQGESKKVFSLSQGFPADRAFCVTMLSDGPLLCGAGGILLKYDGRRWTAVRRGLGFIHSIFEGLDKSVWIATSTGLYRWRTDSWIQLGRQEGLRADKIFDLFQDLSGRMRLATSDGLFVGEEGVDIDAPIARFRDPEGVRGLTVGDTLKVDFEGIDKWSYTDADRLVYAFKLDSGEWSAFEDRDSLELSKLTAGDHQLAIRAMDRAWNVQEVPVTLDFSVAAALHRDPRFRWLAGFATLTIVALAGLAVNRHFRLKRSYLEIEKQVADRTRQLEIANEKLLSHQKMRALGTLAAGVAHDFNSILSIVKGSAQLIEKNLEHPEKIQNRVEKIKVVVDQGASLVKSMLGLSRTTPESSEPFDVNQVLERVVELVGDRFLNEVRLECLPCDELLEVIGSAELVQQILLNLLINAADSMNGRGRVQLRSTPVAELPVDLALSPVPAARYARVEVMDEGCGISAENLTRIFEPFFTTKAFSSRRGTGLGLSMVYEFSKEMGYGLSVQSKESQGSQFCLFLPLERASEE